MLHPGKVGVAGRRNAVFPSAVACQLFAAPVAVVKRRVGEDEVRFQVGMGVVQE